MKHNFNKIWEMSMKRAYLFVLAWCCAFILTSCSTCNNPNRQIDFLTESWLCKLNNDPNRWLQCADPWFLRGTPNAIECGNLRASCSKSMTKMVVRVSDCFNTIRVAGDFQVQILGGQDHNTVHILGPNGGARRVAIDSYNNTLFVHQTPATDRSPCSPDQSVNKVIVRIGIRQLRNVTTYGHGHVFARDIRTPHLVINAHGSGNIMLVGDMNLQQVNQTGGGTISVFGAHTPYLNIRSLGWGNINITGKVGIRNIINKCSGYVRIIGADSPALTIDAGGNSRTSVIGYSNLRKLYAKENSRVYLYWVNACEADVLVCGCARVGLAGITQNLNVNVQGNSQFLGSYLQSRNAYVRTNGTSHANVAANHRLFAEAKGSSHIYYYGKPILSDFADPGAMILPVVSNATCACELPPGRPDCLSGGCVQPRCFSRCLK